MRHRREVFERENRLHATASGAQHNTSRDTRSKSVYRQESHSCGRKLLGKEQNGHRGLTGNASCEAQRLSRRCLYDRSLQSSAVNNSERGVHTHLPGFQQAKHRSASTTDKPKVSQHLSVKNPKPLSRDKIPSCTHADGLRPSQRYHPSASSMQGESNVNARHNLNSQLLGDIPSATPADGLRPSQRYRCSASSVASESSINARHNQNLPDFFKSKGLPEAHEKQYCGISNVPYEILSAHDNHLPSKLSCKRSVSQGRPSEFEMRQSHDRRQQHQNNSFRFGQNELVRSSCAGQGSISGQNSFSGDLSGQLDPCQIPVIGNQIQSLREETFEFSYATEPQFHPFINSEQHGSGYLGDFYSRAPTNMKPYFDSYTPSDLRLVPSAAKQFEIDQCQHRLPMDNPPNGIPGIAVGLQNRHWFESNKNTFCGNLQELMGRQTLQSSGRAEQNSWTNYHRGISGIAMSSNDQTAMLQGTKPFCLPSGHSSQGFGNSFTGYNSCASGNGYYFTGYGSIARNQSGFKEEPHNVFRMPQNHTVGAFARPRIQTAKSTIQERCRSLGNIPLPPPPLPPRCLLSKPAYGYQNTSEARYLRRGKTSRNGLCRSQGYQFSENQLKNKFKNARDWGSQKFQNTSHGSSGSFEMVGIDKSNHKLTKQAAIIQTTKRNCYNMIGSSQNHESWVQSGTCKHKISQHNQLDQKPIYRPWQNSSSHHSGNSEHKIHVPFNSIKDTVADKDKTNQNLKTAKKLVKGDTLKENVCGDTESKENHNNSLRSIGPGKRRECVKPVVVVSEADSSTFDQGMKPSSRKQSKEMDSKDSASNAKEYCDNTKEVLGANLYRRQGSRINVDTMKNDLSEGKNRKHTNFKKSGALKKHTFRLNQDKKPESFMKLNSKFKQDKLSCRSKEKTVEREKIETRKENKPKPEFKKTSESPPKLKLNSAQSTKDSRPKGKSFQNMGKVFSSPRTKPFSSYIGVSKTSDKYVKKLESLEAKHQHIFSNSSKCLKPDINTRSSSLSKITCPTINTAFSSLSESSRPSTSLKSNIENKILKKFEDAVKKRSLSLDSLKHKQKYVNKDKVTNVKTFHSQQTKVNREQNMDSNSASNIQSQVSEEFFKLGKHSENFIRSCKKRKDKCENGTTIKISKKESSNHTRRDSKLKGKHIVESLKSKTDGANVKTCNAGASVAKKQTAKVSHKMQKDGTIQSCGATLKDGKKDDRKMKENNAKEKKWLKKLKSQPLRKDIANEKTLSPTKICEKRNKCQVSTNSTSKSSLPCNRKNSTLDENVETSKCYRKIEINRRMGSVTRGKYVLSTPTTFVIKQLKQNETKLSSKDEDNDDRFLQACVTARQHLQSRKLSSKAEQNETNKTAKDGVSMKARTTVETMIQNKYGNVNESIGNDDASGKVTEENRSMGIVCGSLDKNVPNELAMQIGNQEENPAVKTNNGSNTVCRRGAHDVGTEACRFISPVTVECCNMPLVSSEDCASRGDHRKGENTIQMTNTTVVQSNMHDTSENRGEIGHVSTGNFEKGQERWHTASGDMLTEEKLLAKTVCKFSDIAQIDGEGISEKKLTYPQTVCAQNNFPAFYNTVSEQNFGIPQTSSHSFCEQSDVLEMYHQYLKAKIDLSHTDRRPLQNVFPPLLVSPSRKPIHVAQSQPCSVSSSRLPLRSSLVPCCREKNRKLLETVDIKTSSSIQDENTYLREGETSLLLYPNCYSSSHSVCRTEACEMDNTEMCVDSGSTINEKLSAVPLANIYGGDDDVFEDSLSMDLDTVDLANDCIDEVRSDYADLDHGYRNVFDDALAEFMDGNTFSLQDKENVEDKFVSSRVDDSVISKTYTVKPQADLLGGFTQETKPNEDSMSPSSYQVRIRSERRKRYQKHFPYPLPKAKSNTVSSERGLYKDAKDFLANFDASKKRSSYKNKVKVITKTTDKVDASKGNEPNVTDLKECKNEACVKSVTDAKQNNCNPGVTKPNSNGLSIDGESVNKADNLKQVETLVAKKRKEDQENDRLYKKQKTEKMRNLSATDRVKAKARLYQTKRNKKVAINIECQKVRDKQAKQPIVKGSKTKQKNDDKQGVHMTKRKLEDNYNNGKADKDSKKIPLIRIKNAKSGLKIIKSDMDAKKTKKENRSGHFNAVTKRLNLYEKEAKQVQDTKQVPDSRQTSKEWKKFKCRVCNELFTKERRLRWHCFAQHKNWCYTCKMKFPDDNARTKHVRNGHNIRTYCRVCSIWFSSKITYKNHLKCKSHLAKEASKLARQNQVKSPGKSVAVPDLNNNHSRSLETSPATKELAEKSEGGKKGSCSESSVKSETESNNGRLLQYCVTCNKSYVKFSTHLKTNKHKGIGKKKLSESKTSSTKKYKKTRNEKSKSPEQNNSVIELTSPQSSMEVNLSPFPCNPILLIKNVAADMPAGHSTPQYHPQYMGYLQSKPEDNADDIYVIEVLDATPKKEPNPGNARTHNHSEESDDVCDIETLEQASNNVEKLKKFKIDGYYQEMMKSHPRFNCDEDKEYSESVLRPDQVVVVVSSDSELS